MKVSGATSVGRSAAPASAGKAQGGFSLGSAGASAGPAQTAPAAGVTGVGSIDALLALQAVGTPLERRRRAVGRAGRILDVLDEVKLALLDGEVGGESLTRLMSAVQTERDATDDPGLEGVLNEIETRAAVELAKLERVRAAA